MGHFSSFPLNLLARTYLTSSFNMESLLKNISKGNPGGNEYSRTENVLLTTEIVFGDVCERSTFIS